MRPNGRLVNGFPIRRRSPRVNYSIVNVPVYASLLVEEVFEDFGVLRAVELTALSVLRRFDVRQKPRMVYVR